MDIESLTSYCLGKKCVTHSFPFGGDTLVFKVAGKMFALSGINEIPCKANLKCDPEWTVELRDLYEDITPGYHMNKTHWNTVNLEGSLNEAFIRELIDHSYNLVVSSLSRKDRIIFEAAY
jgi:predicted DNA-binding protein (MmcQ/YjbR family)